MDIMNNAGELNTAEKGFSRRNFLMALPPPARSPYSAFPAARRRAKTSFPTREPLRRAPTSTGTRRPKRSS